MINQIKKIGGIILLAIVMTIGIFATPSKVEAANDSFYGATSINMNQWYSGTITDNIESRFYKFTLNESGRVTINIQAYMYCSGFYIYDSNGKEIVGCGSNYWNDTTEKYSDIVKYDLTKGDYYFCMKKNYYTGSFEFCMSFTSAYESFQENNKDINNNLIRYANDIRLGVNYKGQIATNDKKDFYRFYLNSDCRLKINYKAYIEHSYVHIYDVNGIERKSYSGWWNNVTNFWQSEEYVDLEKGTYYLCIEGDGDWRTGNYNVKLSRSTSGIRLNKSSITLQRNKTYNLKATLIPSTGEKITWESEYSDVATVNSKGVVKAKKAGYTVIKATVGDGITAECRVYVKPDATKLKKVKAGRKYGNKRSVIWTCSRKKNVTGYQIYYAKSKKGKYRKLNTYYLKRGRRYYFKVRTYTYAYDRTLYSGWSNVKSLYLK